VHPAAIVAAHHALALAATYQRLGVELNAGVQRDILSELYQVVDADDAKRRRNEALHQVYMQMGEETPVQCVYAALQGFAASVWPKWRWQATPPDDATALHRSMFDACRAASVLPARDGAINLLSKRHLDRVLPSGHLNGKSLPGQ
jgi:xanthine dehydrogenase iron-sulfur cluster and FAD-binding subunit A